MGRAFKILIFVGLMAASFQANAGLVLFDDFSGSSLDAATWQASTPFSDSVVNQAGGVVTLENHGTILSRNPIPTTFTAEGRFQFTGSDFDRFQFVTRTDGVTTAPNQTFGSGLRYEFRLHRNDGVGWPSAIFIFEQDDDPALATELASVDFAFGKNQWIDFKVVDDGTNVDFFVTDFVTPVLSVSSAAGNGNLIGLYNREGSGNGSSISAGSTVEIDFLSVTNVPEPTTVLGLLGLIGTAFLRRRRRILRD